VGRKLDFRYDSIIARVAAGEGPGTKLWALYILRYLLFFMLNANAKKKILFDKYL